VQTLAEHLLPELTRHVPPWRAGKTLKRHTSTRSRATGGEFDDTAQTAVIRSAEVLRNFSRSSTGVIQLGGAAAAG